MEMPLVERGFEDDVATTVVSTPSRASARSVAVLKVTPWVTPDVAARALRSARDARSIPITDKATEREWLVAWKERRDETALANLVFGCCIRSIWSAVLYVTRFDPDPEYRAELVSEGFTAVRIAAEKFDLEQDVRFHTYAVYQVRAVLNTAFGKTSRLIRYPDQYKFGKAPEGSARCVASVDAPASSEEPGGTTIGDTIADPDASADRTVDAARDMDRVREALAEAMGHLKAREREVLTMRFGLDGGDKRTLREVGDRYGVTRERARQIEKASLRKLARRLEGLPVGELLEGIDGVR